MMGQTLLIRADASAAVGTGHVMRCLALAQAWRHEGGDVVFAMAETTSAIARRLEHDNFPTKMLDRAAGRSEPAEMLASVASEVHAIWLAVDGYQFSPVYQRNLKECGSKLLWIDDSGQCMPYCADLILNQNLYAAADRYLDRSQETSLLLGPEYVLLREEFLGWNNWRRHFGGTAKRILITMGGSDSQNVTPEILRAVARAGLDIKVDVVVGGSNPHAEIIQQIASGLPCEVTVRKDVPNFAELMAGTDLAVSAAGVTCYELALLQVPMILVTLAGNQVPTAKAFAECGAAVNLGDFESSRPGGLVEAVRGLIIDSEYRRSLASKARSLVDGNGAARVCQALLQNAELQASQVEIARR